MTRPKLLPIVGYISTPDLGVLRLACESHSQGREACMKLKPLGDRIVVKLIEELERTRGGIVLPDTAKEKPQEAEVVATGPGARNEQGERIPMDVKVGDRVVFAKYSGTEYKQDDEEYLILRESDILAVVERERAKAKA